MPPMPPEMATPAEGPRRLDAAAVHPEATPANDAGPTGRHRAGAPGRRRAGRDSAPGNSAPRIARYDDWADQPSVNVLALSAPRHRRAVHHDERRDTVAARAVRDWAATD